MVVEVDSGRHGIDVHEHAVGAELLDQPVEDAAGHAQRYPRVGRG